MTVTGDDEAKRLVADGCLALGAAGQEDFIWGHTSVRDPGGRGVWMKATGWAFEEIDETRVVLVARDGEVLAGDGRRHLEYPIHTEIVARRPDVGAVVHTHSDAANAFSALDLPFLPLNHAGSLFAYPDVPRFTLTGGLIASAELGSALADTIGSARACLIPQHGVVTVGADLQTAVMTAVLLDKACRLQLDAMRAGEIRRFGSEEDTLAKRDLVWAESQYHGGFDYLVRRARGR